MRWWTVRMALLSAALPALAAAQQTTAPAPDRITQDDLKKLMKADKVLVVDVRGAESYAGGHIPGAISVPLNDIEKHVAELKAARKPIVTYCS